jgi:hypothetical protein
MKNLEKVKEILEKIENLRIEMINISFDLNTEEDNYEEIDEFISTEAENAFCILLNQFEIFIEELE